MPKVKKRKVDDDQRSSITDNKKVQIDNAAVAEEDEYESEDEDDEIGVAVAGLNSEDQAAEFEREKTRLLLSNFDEEQMNRYEAFRRANVNRSSVKKFASAILNQTITHNVAVTLSGMSKVFVGEIVEKAREVQVRMNPDVDPVELEQLPLEPRHYREAWRLFKLEKGTVPAAHWRRLGRQGDGMMFR